MTLPSRHTIQNSGPGSLRPSTLLVQRIIYYHKVKFSLKPLNQAKIVKKSCMSIIKVILATEEVITPSLKISQPRKR